MNTKKYVYENGEVVLTGRTAERQTKNFQRGDYGGRVVPKVDMLYEIESIGEPPTWKKWVKMTDLYEIKEQQEDDNEQTIS